MPVSLSLTFSLDMLTGVATYSCWARAVKPEHSSRSADMIAMFLFIFFTLLYLLRKFNKSFSKTAPAEPFLFLPYMGNTVFAYA